MSAMQEQGVSLSDGEAGRVEFGNPPVAETSCGFYFQRIDGWNPIHQGALWEKYRPKYPGLEVFPPVMDPPTKPHPVVSFDFLTFLVRTGFVNATKTQLVQIQDGFLFHNWRKTTEAPEYQRYELIRSELHKDWMTFREYLRERTLQKPVVSRCEMSYFNHLVRGSDWQDFTDLPNLFTIWRGLRSNATARLQTATFAVSYRIERGAVNISVAPAVRMTDGKEILQFTLSSSVEPSSSEDDEIFRSLDECHENAARA